MCVFSNAVYIYIFFFSPPNLESTRILVIPKLEDSFEVPDHFSHLQGEFLRTQLFFCISLSVSLIYSLEILQQGKKPRAVFFHHGGFGHWGILSHVCRPFWCQNWEVVGRMVLPVSGAASHNAPVYPSTPNKESSSSKCQ